MSTEEQISAGRGLSYHDAISSIFNILINLYLIPEKIILNYINMNWESVHQLLLIKEFTGIVFPLIILAFRYKLRNPLIVLCLIQLILIWFMYVNLVEVDSLARLIGATNVVAFYWSYAENLIAIVLVSSILQGLFHWFKNKCVLSSQK